MAISSSSLHTRLELASVEIEARLQDALQLLLWSVVAFFSAALALLMLTLTLLISVLGYPSAAGGRGRSPPFSLFWRLPRYSWYAIDYETRTILLAATIGELKRDVAALDGSR